MPIDKKRFEGVSDRLDEEIASFLRKHREKAFTADEIMGGRVFMCILIYP